ncbi:hypothetical protein AAMO2058_000939900 [Amorphochlora amoebiformis]
MAKPWKPLERDYIGERKEVTCSLDVTRLHPLLENYNLVAQQLKAEAAAAKLEADPKASEKEKAKAAAALAREEKRKRALEKQKNEVIDDPLRLMAMAASVPGADPLSMMSSALPTKASLTSTHVNVSKLTKKSPVHPDFEPWRVKSERILKKYTTNKRIAVRANFLEDTSSSNANAEESKITKRLEQLKEARAKKGRGPTALTQTEYIKHIEKQHQDLKTAWRNGERVLSLRIAIQCAKLLSDTSLPRFYPSKYVLLTKILSTFGRLVFERIKGKSEDAMTAEATESKSSKIVTKLPLDFRANDVHPAAKHTCRNWFFKTVCIRELVQRVYVELALLECHRFLRDDEMLATLMRIAKSLRGIGDPLCATYAKAYLATKLVDVEPYLLAAPGQQLTDPTADTLNDFMFCFKYYKEREFKDITAVSTGSISIEDYIDILAPALEWIIQIVGREGSEGTFFTLLQQYKDFCDSSVVLVHILSSFKSSLVSKHAAMLTSLIKQSKDNLVPRPKLYRALGVSLCKTPPPKEVRLSILNEIWKTATKIQDISLYLEVSEVFVEYIAKNFSDRELNIFLKDVIKHMKKSNLEDETTLQGYLTGMVSKIVESCKDLFKVVAMANFLPVVDFLGKSDKVRISKKLLKKFVALERTTSDPVIIHTLFDLARNIHDSIDELTYGDERRQVSELIVSVIRRVDYGRDLERQLNLYVDCRRAFTQLDAVTFELVVRVCLLVVKAHRFMNGKHNRKTSAFVKACLAYSHITIPSLNGAFLKLRLYLQCAQVALVNNMVSQGEALLKSAVQLIPEVPEFILEEHVGSDRKSKHRSETEMLPYVLNLASFLLIFPGHPSVKNGPFHLVKGLLNAVQKYAPWTKPCVSKCELYLGLVRLFCAFSQRSFAYHVPRVDSNDTLFGSNEIYEKSLEHFTDTLLTETLNQLHGVVESKERGAKEAQATLSLDLVNILLSTMTMNKKSATLVVKLYRLAAGVTQDDVKKYQNRTLEHAEAKKGTWYQDIVTQLRSK